MSFAMCACLVRAAKLFDRFMEEERKRSYSVSSLRFNRLNQDFSVVVLGRRGLILSHLKSLLIWKLLCNIVSIGLRLGDSLRQRSFVP